MKLIDKLANLFNNHKMDEYINLLIITPLLGLLQTSWIDTSILILVIAVILVIKCILLTIINFASSKSQKNKSTSLLWKFISNLIIVPFLYLQYKSSEYTKYNKWFSAIAVFHNIVKLFIGKTKQETKETKKIIKNNKPIKINQNLLSIELADEIKDIKKNKIKPKHKKNKITKKQVKYFITHYKLI